MPQVSCDNACGAEVWQGVGCGDRLSAGAGRWACGAGRV